MGHRPIPSIIASAAAAAAAWYEQALSRRIRARYHHMIHLEIHAVQYVVVK